MRSALMVEPPGSGIQTRRQTAVRRVSEPGIADGSMFWLSRKTFVGSYRFFSETKRAYVSSLYDVCAASASPRKLTYAIPVDASDAAAITVRAHSWWGGPASGSCQPVTALS